jgi:hypothetical protein
MRLPAFRDSLLAIGSARFRAPDPSFKCFKGRRSDSEEGDLEEDREHSTSECSYSLIIIIRRAFAEEVPHVIIH